MIFVTLLACFVVVNGNGVIVEPHQPQPYKFGYTIKDKGGVQHREEAGNGAGVVEGNYGFVDNKGLRRQVNYVADHAGFRAAIKTNEPGTAGQNPAAVLMMSNDPYAQGTPVPYVSRVNDPVVHALSDGVYGFPTIYGYKAHGPALQAPYNPLHGHGLAMPIHRVHPLNGGYMLLPKDGLLGYGPGYVGGLAYSNLLGAGYRGQAGIVNFGDNLIGGVIRGYDSRFTSL